MYNYIEYEPEHSCKQCEEKEQRIDDAREFLEGIIDHLYGSQPLDKVNLQHCIEELCHFLGVHFDRDELNIARNKSKIEPYLKDWMSFNQNYLKEMA